MSTDRQKLVVRCLMMSVDGFAAGENQRLDQPFGDNTDGFTDWMFATRSGNEMLGLEGGEDNGDEPYVAHSFDDVGAVILGRNMFGVSRGPWTDDGWVGWWGDEPAVPRADVRAHPSRSRSDPDGGRHDLPLRDRRDRGRPASGRSPRPTARTSGSWAARRRSASTSMPAW